MSGTALTRPRADDAVAGTARFIARNLLAASHESRYAAILPAGAGDACRHLLTATGDAAFVRAVGNRLFRGAFRAGADFLLPGIVLHYLARKRCLEDWVRQAMDEEGCERVAVLGAGLDTLAWRLHRARPGVRFVELDRPAALRIKRAALAAAGEPLPSNLSFLPLDLAHGTLAQALAAGGAFGPSVRTLFLAEGLLMYLPPERVASLLREVAAWGTADRPVRFAFTFMEARADGRIRFRRSSPLVHWWLRWQGEPFRWSVAPDKLAAFLSPLGWRLRELVSGDDLRTRCLLPAGLRDEPLALGEWLALAETVH